MESVWKSLASGMDAIKDKISELEIKSRIQQMASVEQYYYYNQ
jgi:hypothetical protein